MISLWFAACVWVTPDEFEARRDVDGDGFASQQFSGPDCDDTDPAINPAAEDAPGDGVDADCDGEDPDGTTPTSAATGSTGDTGAAAVELVCADGVDDDEDGDTDCDDADCAADVVCAPRLLINEVLADAADIDANCDGRLNAGDEFVEIVNVGVAAVDLDEAVLSDSTQERHTFRDLELAPGELVVVFASGTFGKSAGGLADEPWCLPRPGNVVIDFASSRSLGLDEVGDTVTLLLDSGESFGATWGTEGDNGVSLNRNPDGSDSALVRHNIVAGNAGGLSPLRGVDLEVLTLVPPDE